MSEKAPRRLGIDDDGPRAYSVAETARRLGVCRDTVYDLIYRGQLRSTRLGRRRVIPASALAELLDKGAQ